MKIEPMNDDALKALRERRDEAVENGDRWDCAPADLLAAYAAGERSFDRAYLEGAYLEGANLKGAYLEGAYLEGANLKGAYLEGAYLEGANLKGANLKGANLKGAYLEGANLKGAYLEGANLKGAYLEGAYLEGANLKGAYLEGANLKGAKCLLAIYVPEMSSRGDWLYASSGHADAEGGIMFRTGCQWLDRKALLARVDAEKGISLSGELYRAAIEFAFMALTKVYPPEAKPDVEVAEATPAESSESVF